MTALFIFLGILLSGDYLAVTVFRRKFGEITPFTLCAVSIITYCFGLMHLLSVGAMVIGVMAICIYILGTVIIIKRHEFAVLRKGFINAVFLCFFVVCLILVWGDYGQLANGYDEIGHWHDCVKVMIGLDDFYANPAGQSTFGNYPPFMALLQYVVQLLNININGAVFCEWINYLIYHAFTFSLFLPVLVVINGKEDGKQNGEQKKAKIVFVLSVLIVLLLPTVFFQKVFSSTMIDPFMAAAAGVLFFMIANRKKIQCGNVIICLLIPGLILTKDLGLLFAVFGLILLLYCAIKEKKFKVFIITLCGSVFAKVSWDIVKRVNNTIDPKPNSVNWWNYLKALFGSYGELEEYKIESVTNYRTALIDKTSSVGNTYFKLDICYLVLFLLLIVLYVVWYRKKRKNNEQEYLLPNIIIYGAMLFSFLFGLGGVYMDKFVYTEAVALASYQRYVNTLAGILFVEIVLFIMVDKKRFTGRNAWLVLIGIILISPVNNIYNFIIRDYPEKQYEARKDADLFAEEIVENCKDGSNVYLISQRNKGWDYLVIKFMARPNIVLQSIAGDDYNWSFAENPNPDDIYTKAMSLDQWSDELFNGNTYDYVAVVKSDNYFQDTFISLFENVEKIPPHSIYKINRDKRCLEQVYVRAAE